MWREAFGEALFSGSPFIRNATSPLLAIFMAAFPFLIERWTAATLAIAILVELLRACLLAGFWLPAKIGRWSFRLLCLLVFLGYAFYLGDMLLAEGDVETKPVRRSETSPANATLGFIAIGLPCLWYAATGRFRKNKLDDAQERLAGRKAEGNGGPPQGI